MVRCDDKDIRAGLVVGRGKFLGGQRRDVIVNAMVPDAVRGARSFLTPQVLTPWKDNSS